MRLTFLFPVLLLCCLARPAWPDDAADRAALYELMNAALMDCINEVEAAVGVENAQDTRHIDACMEAKGIDLQNESGNEEQGRVYSGGGSASNHRETGDYYQVEDVNALIESLESQAPQSPNAGQPGQAGVADSMPAEKQPQEEPPSPGVFLPSGKAPDGPKPIFLNR